MEPISITIGAVIGLASMAADFLHRKAVLGAIHGANGALFAAQLLSTAYLASRIEQVNKKVGQVGAALGRVEVRTEQIQRVQLAQAMAPIRQAIEKIHEIRAGGDSDYEARGELLDVVGLLEGGAANVHQALDAFSGVELLELVEIVQKLLGALAESAGCEIALKAAMGYSPGRLARVAERYSVTYAAAAAKLRTMPRFDQTIPSPTMLRAARTLGFANPAEMRRQVIGMLEQVEQQFLVERGKLALLVDDGSAAAANPV